MESKRLFLIIGILTAAVIFLLYIMNSSAFEFLEKRKQQTDDIRTGERSTRGGRGKITPPAVKRSSKAADRILEIRLPVGDPRSVIGGTVVLALQGNSVLRRRQDPTKLPLIKNLLGRKNADALLVQALALEETPMPPKLAYRMTIVTAAGKRVINLPESAINPLLTTHHPNGTAWTPESISLQVLEVTHADGTPKKMPWPFRSSPDDYLASPTKVTALRATLHKFLRNWQPDILVEHQDGDSSKYYRIVALTLL